MIFYFNGLEILFSDFQQNIILRYRFLTFPYTPLIKKKIVRLSDLEKVDLPCLLKIIPKSVNLFPKSTSCQSPNDCR